MEVRGGTSTTAKRQWTMDENVALFKIVKKVEEDGATASVGGKPTSTLWQVVAAEVEIQLPGRGAAAKRHYDCILADLEKSLPAGQFVSLPTSSRKRGRVMAGSGQWMKTWHSSKSLRKWKRTAPLRAEDP